MMYRNRRDFIKKTAAGVVGIAAASIPGITNAADFNLNTSVKTDIKLGVASYTLREFSLEEALDMTLRIGLHRITLKSMHLPLDSDGY